MNVKNKKTYYQIILDKSGSMNDCIESTVNGFNEQMQMIKELQDKFPKQEILVSLTTFNHDVFFDVECASPSKLKEMKSNCQSMSWIENTKDFIIYDANGLTSLYDAIGYSVNKIKSISEKEVLEDKATVVVVIITDGYENSSQKYNYSQIQSMIKELEKSDNWTFTYLSNTIDAIEKAKDLNIKSSNSFMYSKSNMSNVYDDMNDSLDAYISKKRNIGFFNLFSFVKYLMVKKHTIPEKF